MTPETRKKVSEKLKGRRLSEEHRSNMSASLSGEKNGFYGKVHSENTLIKIRDILKKSLKKVAINKE